MENKYFNEALHNFTSDYAYGSRIRHLYERGYSAHGIKERLDYPIAYEAVFEYLRGYLIKSKKIVFEKCDIPVCNSSASYETKYDSYGRKSFILKNPGSHRDIQYKAVHFIGNIKDIPNLYDCYAYIQSPFPQNDLLNNKQTDYLSGLPFPDKPFYILINEPLADILDILHTHDLWHAAIISSKTETEYMM